MNKKLCSDIEKALGKEMRTPKDFDFLRERIFARLNVWVSTTTLKRIWGYLKDDVQTRHSTLDILACFLGFHSYENYTNSSAENVVQESSPIMSRRLCVSEELKEGDKLLITWLPNRTCELLYCGNLKFEVISSEHTRLKPGNTFRCGLFIEGEPLYLDELIQENYPPIAYVCGKKSGIRFERNISLYTRK